MHDQMSPEMQECIRVCEQCHDACLTTTRHCLQMGGQHAAPQHITLLLDCAQICTTSADFMLRGSDLHGRVCGVCAEVCERCAEDCERVDPHDQQMQMCAQTCRQCAESCRRMASAVSA
jgi:hypothetical protein